MNKIERINAVIAGKQPDRTPLSFWHHFGPEAVFGPNAVAAHLRHMETYDLDFLKVMDDNRYPRPASSSGLITCKDDLSRLKVLNGDEDTFEKQLDLIGRLRERLGKGVFMVTTVFNSWSTLRQLTMADSGEHSAGPSVGPKPGDRIMTGLLREAPSVFAQALDVIARSLSNFVHKAVRAGADGIFLSVRDDWVDTPENGNGTYNRLVRPGDMLLLERLLEDEAPFSVLHVCGKAMDFKRFASYPVQAVNWADRHAGPAIKDVAGWLKPAICAGLDNQGTMVDGSPECCAQEMEDAVQQAAGRPIILAPGCTFDPKDVPEKNLQAIRKSVDKFPVFRPH
jgi:uroporphyrinogen decarboxylase